MASGDENFPVPKIRRDRKILPAITNGWLENDITNNHRKFGEFVEGGRRLKAA